MKVLIPLDIPEDGIDLMRQNGISVSAWTSDDPMPIDQVVRECQSHNALLSSSPYPIDASFLKQCPHLRIIAQFAAGYDNVDIEEATKRGIPIGNTPGAMSHATADIAFGLLLAVARKMFYTHQTIKDGRWGQFIPKAYRGQELKQKTLGIFGMGRIGMEMAGRCKGAYDMKILYHNRSRNVKAEEMLNARWVDFQTLLKNCDIISVHSVLSEETREIFDFTAFKKMKPSAIFINTARGGIHNEPDLVRAMQEGEIWGVGLDVTNPEPMSSTHPLLSMENAAVTPHIGSATIRARSEMSLMAAKNIIARHLGTPIPYLVNPAWHLNARL